MGIIFRPRIVTGTSLAAIGLSLLFSLTPAPAQTQTKSARPPTFDVASVKPDRSGSGGMSMRASHGRLTAMNATVRELIESAFRVKSFQVAGGPAWLGAERYDIVAKTENSQVGDDDLWLLLQPLLMERFGLKFHRETKELPVYSLLVGTKGNRLSQPRAGEGSSMRVSSGSGGAKMIATKMPLAKLADMLGNRLGRAVIDRTGLNGDFDFKLEWSEERKDPDSSFDVGIEDLLGLSRPSISTAVQEQLGLRLESAKGPVDIIVIDGAERASPN